MNDPIIINGFLFRKTEIEDVLILRDDDFNENYLKSSVVDYMMSSGVKALELNESFNERVVDLDFLKQVLWIESITIIKSGVTNYQNLKCLIGLKRITNNYTSESIDFSAFKKLESANILWAEGRTNLLECESLEVLILYKYNGKKMLDFEHLKHLKHLELISSSIDSIDGIEHLGNLETIELSYNNKLSDLSKLSKYKKLKKIKLDNLSKIENLFFLEGCKELEYVSIKNCNKINDNTSLFKLTDLKVLGYLKSGTFTTIKGIEHLQNLEKLVFYDTDIMDGDLEPIRKLKKLNYCYFKDKKHYNLKHKDFSLP